MWQISNMGKIVLIFYELQLYHIFTLKYKQTGKTWEISCLIASSVQLMICLLAKIWEREVVGSGKNWDQTGAILYIPDPIVPCN